MRRQTAASRFFQGQWSALFVLPYRFGQCADRRCLQDALVARFRSLVSKRAQKAYMGIFLFITTALSMIGVSTVAYFIFYYKLIPQVELERLVHLQFG